MDLKKDLLDRMKIIHFPTQNRRFNVRRGNLTNCAYGIPEAKCKAEQPRGFVLGKVRVRGDGLRDDGRIIRTSNLTQTPKYKPVFESASKLMKKTDPNFKFTSIQFNKNNRTRKHKDALNIGESYIIGLGDYKDGDIMVYDEDGKSPKSFDIKNKWKKFNGSILPHETAPFSGDRYTMVYYNIMGKNRKMTTEPWGQKK
jgi:hypothetical protein